MVSVTIFLRSTQVKVGISTRLKPVVSVSFHRVSTAGGSDEHPASPPIPLRRVSIIRRLLLDPSFPLGSLENRAAALFSMPLESGPRHSSQLRLDRPAETTLYRPPCNHAKGARIRCWACRQNSLRNQNPYRRHRCSPSGQEL